MKTILMASATAAIGAGIILGAAGPAYAYAGSCSGTIGYTNMQVREFSMQNAGNDSSLVTVEVLAPMSQADAQKYLENQYSEASFSLVGDDSAQDRVLAQVNTERYAASPAGLTIRGGSVISNQTLDEDNRLGPDLDSFPEHTDEFYVDVRLHYLSTGSAQTAESCRLSLT